MNGFVVRIISPNSTEGMEQPFDRKIRQLENALLEIASDQEIDVDSRVDVACRPLTSTLGAHPASVLARKPSDRYCPSRVCRCPKS